ncbi:MAG: hypothetical protein ABIO45_14815 [Burkholderiaceae bacterium]
MNTAIARQCVTADAAWPRRIARALLDRQRSLALFGATLLFLLLPGAIAWSLDDRTLRGANVWIKPMKFSLSIAVLALTTAWFIGHLPRDRRGATGVRAAVAMILGAGSFELVYITLQAALGEASHYNVGDAFHATMYTLMGIGAIVLTASQPLLAWQIYRHGDASLAPAYRSAVVLGLGLTFVLGAGAGIPLSALPPATGPGLSILGWSTVMGDLRPAHFLGIHAAQLIPLTGAAIVGARIARPRAAVRFVAIAYVALWAALMAQALSGLPLVRL